MVLQGVKYTLSQLHADIARAWMTRCTTAGLPTKSSWPFR